MCFSWKNARHVPAPSCSQRSDDAPANTQSGAQLGSHHWSMASVERDHSFPGPPSHRNQFLPNVVASSNRTVSCSKERGYVQFER